MRAVAPAIVLSVGLALSGCAKAEDVADAAPPETSTSPDEPPESTPTTESTPTESSPTVTTPTQTKPPESELASTPAVGNCYNVSKLGFKRQRDGSFPVPCKRTHTSETFLVSRVGTSPGPNEIDAVWRTCHDKFRGYVGGSATVSTLGIALIMPSTGQTVAGQGWVRCDVIERANFNGKGGVARTGSLRDTLAEEVPDRFRACSKRWPKVLQKVHFSSCDRFHQAELIPESKRIGGPDDPFPGLPTSRSSSAAYCERRVLEYVPEALRYYYYYPTRASWSAGSRD
ncbi:MAG: septum formation family protein, partial [Nocardioidaceae bacterium]